MNLTKNDKLILESYCQMLSRLSGYLGSAYEISLHSLEDYHHSVISIHNGYHSGRSVGAPITDLALNMLKRIEDNDVDATDSYTSYNVINNAGEHLKSSTIPIIGDKGRIIGLLCINLYLDMPFYDIIQSYSNHANETCLSENLTNSVNDTVTKATIEAKNYVMFNTNIAAVNKNKVLIQLLYDRGIFHMKDSVEKVAEILGISKNTVYLHLRNIKSSSNF